MINIIHKILTSPLWWIIDGFILIIAIIAVKYYKEIIGWFGEHWVRKELVKLPKDKYRVLNNIMISVNDRTIQIDHIVFQNMEYLL